MKRALQNPRFILVLTALAFFGLVTGTTMGDDDHGYRRDAVHPVVTNDLYTQECGSCHFAYPPGLLPGASWDKIMSELDQHFGDNAEMQSQTKQTLLAYLKDNSADRANSRLSKKFMRSMRGQIPVRITQVPYFKHEHDEVPERLVKGNPEVKSLSHCDKCHQNASQGSFNEHDVKIPGHGRWDD